MFCYGRIISKVRLMIFWGVGRSKGERGMGGKFMEANREEKEGYVVGWRGFLTYQERDRRTQDLV